ncbi:MAG: hypothetical protein HKO59_12610 [Phycisphaerales bacterium]|nr:hypothetical protein [Phycisphaerae bacterium]NNF44662.1 hypothetical protein [Phycisphaerales bacterium]NNM26804.1 hypothetical protein [Phycisphaerales bacterium]
MPHHTQKSMQRVERCPCGSGKPREQCCGNPAQNLVKRVVVLTLILIVTGAAIALGVTYVNDARDQIAPSAPASAFTGATTQPNEYNPVTNQHWDASHGHWHDGLPPGSDAPLTSGLRPDSGTPLASGATTPQPWEYDPATNKHWHPTHGHWHDGPPPNQNPAVVNAQASGDLGSVAPDILNPKPWQYDPASNKHYHAGHGHWHDGPPPPESERGP